MYIIIYKIEYHVRVVHGGATVTFFCKTIVVIPWFHQFYQLVYRMIEWARCGVVFQHIPYILFCESCHFIELWIQCVIGADVESAGQVIHGNRAHSRHKTTLDSRVRSGLYGVEKTAQVTGAVCLASIIVQA